MATVTRGARSADTSDKSVQAAPTIQKLLKEEDAKYDLGVRYEADNVDSLYIRSPGPKFSQADGRHIGWDRGVHMEFSHGGMTRTYDVKGNALHAAYVAEVDEILAMDPPHPDVVQFNIKKVKRAGARRPFNKWNEQNAKTLKIALEVNLDEGDADANVYTLKEAARYERDNLNRSDVLAMLEALIAMELAPTADDDFDEEVKLK